MQTGVEWWEQTLATQFPNSPHQLDFQFDFTYADNPVLTNYEPISQISDYFQYWMYDFLNPLGYNQGGSFSNDIRAFNHAQRLAHGTDWAFTVFVVNDTVDGDDKFALGSSFPQAFSYAGGQFMVSPASRPASTFAHETGTHVLGQRRVSRRRLVHWTAAATTTPRTGTPPTIPRPVSRKSSASCGRTRWTPRITRTPVRLLRWR